MLAVQIPKKARIRQTCAQDAFIASDNRRTTIRGGDIRHQRKAWRGRPIRLAQREIALIDAHGGAHHFRRQIHEGVINRTKQRHRPFHQARDFGDQRFIRHHFKAQLGRKAIDAITDQRCAIFGFQHHMARGERIFVIVKMVRAESAGGQDAMPFGQIAAC